MTTNRRCDPIRRPLYEAVLPLILSTFEEPLPIKAAAAKLEVKDAQLKVWVDRAVQQGLMEKVKGRGAKFRTVAGAVAQGSLFGSKGRPMILRG